jgi:hypothetical protein
MTNGQMTNGQMSELTEVGREVEAMSDVQRWLLRESVGTGYNIYERVFQFAVRVVRFVRTFPRTLDAVEVGRQLVRSATSVGANPASGCVSVKPPRSAMRRKPTAFTKRAMKSFASSAALSPARSGK